MNTQAAEDLAYVRSVAESGEAAPSLSGRFSLWWSSLLIVTLLIHWVLASEFIPGLTLQYVGIAWAVFGIIGFSGSRFLTRNMENYPGASAAINKVDRHTWRAAGLAISGYAIAVIVTASVRADVSFLLCDTIMPAAFLGYAIAYSGSAAFSESNSKWLPVILSIALSACTTLLFGMPALYLVAALGVFVILTLPAIQMLRREPKPVAES